MDNSGFREFAAKRVEEKKEKSAAPVVTEEERAGELPSNAMMNERLTTLEELLKTLKCGLPSKVCGKDFAYLGHKIEQKEEDSKLIFVSMDPIMQPTATEAPLHWSLVGSVSVLPRWTSPSDARSYFANFDELLDSKIPKRFGLSMSPAIRILTDHKFNLVRNPPKELAQLTALQQL